MHDIQLGWSTESPDESVDARLQPSASMFGNRRTKMEYVGVCMGHSDIPGEQVESHFADPGQLAHCTVGDYSYATQRTQDRRMHVADERACPGGFIHVLEHDNAWRRYLQNALPPLRAVMQMGPILPEGLHFVIARWPRSPPSA